MALRKRDEVALETKTDKDYIVLVFPNGLNPGDSLHIPRDPVLTELERSHLVETITQAIADSWELYDGLPVETIDALKECLEILGEPYETDD